MRRKHGQGERGVFEQQSRQYAETQPFAHHVHNAVVAIDGETHVRFHPAVAQQRFRFLYRSASRLDERLLGKRTHRDAVGMCEHVVGRQQHHDRVVVQGDGFKRPSRRRDQKPAVGISVPQGAFELRFVVDAHQVQLHARVFQLEGIRHVGKPMGGNAGGRGDAHHAAL